MQKFLFISYFILWACAPETPKESQYFKSCVLSSEQSGTLTGRWPVTPISIALSANHFTSEEQIAIQKAVLTWKKFYQSSGNLEIFDTGFESEIQSAPEPTSISAALCTEESIIQGNSFASPIRISKSRNWAYEDEQIALTTFCRTTETQVPSFFQAVIEINFENYFNEGQKIPDLESIILHELGHLLGLDHNCETSIRDGFPNCSLSSQAAIWSKASMYPHFGFADGIHGEIRNNLNQNDQERANCLYGPNSLP